MLASGADGIGLAVIHASLTVFPTLGAWTGVDKAFGVGAFHWFMLAQPLDFPERLLAAAPGGFINDGLARMAGGLDRFEPKVLDAYCRTFRDPAVRHAVCEDFRATGHMPPCPVLVLWPESHKAGETPLDTGRHRAADVSGRAISGDHLQPELSAGKLPTELLSFLARIRWTAWRGEPS